MLRRVFRRYAQKASSKESHAGSRAFIHDLIPVFGGGIATWLRGGRFAWQLRLPCFLLIMSGFWMMMYQLWDLHPNFIRDWIDSSMVAAYAPARWRFHVK